MTLKCLTTHHDKSRSNSCNVKEGGVSTPFLFPSASKHWSTPLTWLQNITTTHNPSGMFTWYNLSTTFTHSLIVSLSYNRYCKYLLLFLQFIQAFVARPLHPTTTYTSQLCFTLWFISLRWHDQLTSPTPGSEVCRASITSYLCSYSSERLWYCHVNFVMQMSSSVHYLASPDWAKAAQSEESSSTPAWCKCKWFICVLKEVWGQQCLKSEQFGTGDIPRIVKEEYG